MKYMVILSRELTRDQENNTYYIDARGDSLPQLINSARITIVDQFEREFTMLLEDAPDSIYEAAVEELHEETNR